MPAIITPEFGAYAPISRPIIDPVFLLNTIDPDCPGLVCMFIVAYFDLTPELSNNIFAQTSASWYVKTRLPITQ